VLEALAQPPFHTTCRRNLHCELGIRFVDSPSIARLNQRYLRHAGVTDVIAFDYGRPEHALEHHRWLRGDIFVCLDVAELQAHQFRTSSERELLRYVLHGMLHLAGYEDGQLEARRRMKRAENRLVQLLGKRFPVDRLLCHPKRSARLGSGSRLGRPPTKASAA
jgi:rRNA maturation RNase YbeY